jgi:hypothetical protein
MNDRYNLHADRVARARMLIARASKGVEQLENVASQAFCRLTALAGMLNRLEQLAQSCDPDAADAAQFDAVTVCREAEVLLRYLDSRTWGSDRVVANGRDRVRTPIRLGGSLATGG